MYSSRGKLIAVFVAIAMISVMVIACENSPNSKNTEDGDWNYATSVWHPIASLDELDVEGAKISNVCQINSGPGTGQPFRLFGAGPVAFVADYNNDDSSSSFNWYIDGEADALMKMILTEEGNLGIGTTSPEAKLDVRGYTARIESDGHAIFEIQAGGVGSAYLHLYPVSSTKRWQIIAREDLDKLQFWPGDIYFTRGGDIEKPGSNAFVQDHPNDPSKEIVYVCLEGPEAGTYIRGTAQLVDGEAVVNLPQHFSLVTSDEGLTVQLTPVGEWLQLYVVEKGTQRIVVREANGKNGQFDYIVQGVRKGYENHEVIRDKE